MSSVRKTLEQQRAKLAWEQIQSIKALHKDELEKKYSSLVKKLPMYILTNGLGQTLAFVCSKAKEGNEHQRLYDHLDAWSRESWSAVGQFGDTETSGDAESRTHLLAWLIEQDSALYRRVTVGVLAYITWLKRFAEASLKSEEEDEAVQSMGETASNSQDTPSEESGGEDMGAIPKGGDDG
ncbi:MAG: type III-B CRISPR module-associated protein Cmr5 [Anaerolineae bacterium]